MFYFFISFNEIFVHDPSSILFIMFANKLYNILTLVNMFVVCMICSHSYTFFCIVLLHFILNIHFLNEGGLNELFISFKYW